MILRRKTGEPYGVNGGWIYNNLLAFSHLHGMYCTVQSLIIRLAIRPFVQGHHIRNESDKVIH